MVDTDAVVAAFRSPTGASAELLLRIERGEAVMLMSVALALEYESICLKQEHREAAGLTYRQAVAVVDALIGLGERVRIRYRLRPQLRDAGDEMVFETAVNGRAGAIVTFNVRDYGKVGAHFGIEILQPREAVRRLRQ